MAAILGIIVVVVEIKPRGPKVELVGFLCIPDFRCQYRMDTMGKLGFVYCQWFIEVEVPFNDCSVVLILEEEKTLQGIGLLDVRGSENPVPGPILVEWPFVFRQFRCWHQLLIQEAVLL